MPPRPRQRGKHSSRRRRPHKGDSRRDQEGARHKARIWKQAPAKRVARRPDDEEFETHPTGERLQKVLASAGIASRRECEELIREGRVEVDRQVVTALGTRVDPQRQEIRVDGEPLPRPKLVYFAVHKPVGVVSTSRDPAGRPRVIDLLPPNTPRAFAVGRLDISSEGLILITNDGELANGLTHPRHGVEKVYQVQVAGQVERDIVAKLQRGVRLAEGFAHAKRIRIKSRRKKSTLLEMVLDEGRNREIRRLLAHLGHKVQRLRRIAVGPVRLGELPVGAVRRLAQQEVSALQRAIARPRPETRQERESGERGGKERSKHRDTGHPEHREERAKRRTATASHNPRRTKRATVFRKTRKGSSRKGAKAQN